MSENKSKFPDIKEVTGMVTKLFTDIKKSFLEIFQSYQTTRSPKSHPRSGTKVASAEAKKSEHKKEEAVAKPKKKPATKTTTKTATTKTAKKD